MSNYRIYSPFFQTLYDQPEPVGQLGRGGHYSVLRAVTHRDIHGAPLDEARFQDFAIIWDEDHDERVIEVVEQMYFVGLLAPAKVIGERKASMTVILDSASRLADEPAVSNYLARLEELDPSSDCFTKAVPLGHTGGLVHDAEQRVQRFLDHIQDIHQLGHKPAESTRWWETPAGVRAGDA